MYFGVLSQSQFLPSVVVEGDPYFGNVVALLHFEGADGATTITDVTGRSWTASNGAALDTTIKQFGGSSVFFDGVNDYVSTADSPDLRADGDLTIELSVYLNEFGTWFLGKRDSTIDEYGMFTGAGGDIHFAAWTADTQAVAFQLTSASTFFLGQMYQLAVTKSGSTWRLFVDGVLEDTKTQTSAIAAGNRALRLGGSGTTTQFTDCWIDEFRFTKGVARYTASYTPATEAFPHSGGVPTDYVIYYSFDNVAGSTIFDEAGNYDATINGNIYVADGYSGKGIHAERSNNSYVDIGNVTELNNGSKDFSVSLWLKTGSVEPDTDDYIFGAQTGSGLYLRHARASNAPNYGLLAKIDDEVNDAFDYTPEPFNDNEWHHVVAVNEGSNLYLYVNGVKKTEVLGHNVGAMDANLTLLAANLGAGGFFSFASVDEFRVYSRGLNIQEISALYLQDSDYTATVPTDWVAYWPCSVIGSVFQEASGVFNGTISGATITTGVIRDGIAFNGSSQRITCQSPSVIESGANNFTISCWIKTSTSGVANYFIGHTVNVGAYMRIEADNTLLVKIDDGTNDAFDTGVTGIADGIWHHVAMVNVGNTLLGYVDGVEEINIAGHNVGAMPASSFYIGGISGSTENYFTGDMDEIRVYGRALSSTEIGRLASENTA